ncbi:MAG TPA: DUF72 domain-containing protein, partial [Thermoanaerobaculia bacterium]|nr:DUF72 domain-containing protein [Thermoanaerobaculia bacterium]
MGRRKAPPIPDGQLALFPGARPEPEAAAEGVGPAAVPEEIVRLGQELAPGIRLGPSTWSYPGWAGIVYDRHYPLSRLAREGLAAVARHPLFRAVGIDRTHYAPVTAAEL